MAGVNRSGSRVVGGDRCPGVLRPHLAADGAMVRVRVPGGQTTGGALGQLSAVAERYGRGLIQLTSRASVQIRGLPAELPDGVATDVARAGFLPSVEHERVRNIAASPLTGLSGGRADLRPMISDLDRAIVADPDLAELPGRFLFVLDDGRGDVAALSFDIAYRAWGPDAGEVMMGARRWSTTTRAAVPRMIDLAGEFLAERGTAWRVREIAPTAEPSPSPALTTPLGAIDGHASVAAPLGHLTPTQVRAVRHVSGGGPIVITPWRGLIMPGAAGQLDRLAAAGLVIDDDSAWKLVTACVGAPWCASGRADTQAWATALAAEGTSARTHLSGCERRCGAPAAQHLDLVAP